MVHSVKPKWVRNAKKDGDKPVCPFCDRPYGDGDIFDVKNYPEDGGAVMFFECEVCEKEASILCDWSDMH